MAMLLFWFLVFIVFLIMLYFVLVKIANPVDKKVRSREFKKKHIDDIKHEIAVKQMEVDALSRSTVLQEDKQEAEKELNELKELHKKIIKDRGEN
ncbi:MAG: hypothetical protein L0I79_04905 [Atopostipes sp.]|nr:hypothetical protein [Atopostipes sp.]